MPLAAGRKLVLIIFLYLSAAMEMFKQKSVILHDNNLQVIRIAKLIKEFKSFAFIIVIKFRIGETSDIYITDVYILNYVILSRIKSK